MKPNLIDVRKLHIVIQIPRCPVPALWLSILWCDCSLLKCVEECKTSKDMHSKYIFRWKVHVSQYTFGIDVCDFSLFKIWFVILLGPGHYWRTHCLPNLTTLPTFWDHDSHFSTSPNNLVCASTALVWQIVRLYSSEWYLRGYILLQMRQVSDDVRCV